MTSRSRINRTVWRPMLFLHVAKEIGQGRLIIGVHYPGDVAAGTTLGKAIGAEVIASGAFQKDAEAARQETDSVLTKK